MTCVPQKLISASIRHLRLTHLRVIFHCDIHGPDGTPAYWEGLIESARNVDLRTAAATLSHGNSNLQYVFTTTTGSTGATILLMDGSALAAGA